MVYSLLKGIKRVDDSFEFCFEPRPEFFYGIKIWRVGRQEDKVATSAFYQFSGSLTFVKGCVVHNNHVTWT